MTQAQSSLLLSPRQIAGWQIPTAATTASTVRAELPALQRGAVWSARQVESLWDSMLRGFPIGAFLLAPFLAARGSKAMQYQLEGGPTAEPTHHLLDGQQRSNAIALGFLDPWKKPGDWAPPATLWIDLKAPKANDERDFVLRLLTRAHPWGYRYDALASDGPRMTAQAIRNAMAAYEKATPGVIQKSLSHTPLTHTWPWEAFAPVPLSFLLEAADSDDDVRARLLERLSELPFWDRTVHTSQKGDWRRNVTRLLEAQSGRDAAHIGRIIAGAKTVMSKDEATAYRIPGLVLPRFASLAGVSTRGAGREEQAERQDDVETLFIRINSSGTPLTGEELIYSILKSEWPEAERFIEMMDLRLAPPSRIVVLAARLVLAGEKAFAQRPPAAPDVTRFRRLIHGADRDCKKFKDKLLEFFDGRAPKVFRTARDLLADGGDGLPPILIADIARSSPDVLFLLLRWVQRLLEDGREPGALKPEVKKTVLGAVTALSWFAEDQRRCLSALWPSLQSMSERRLASFFFAPTFGRCFRISRGRLGLLPLVPPRILEQVIEKNVFGHGFETSTGRFWQNWGWGTLSESSVDDRRMGGKLGRWYKKSFKRTRGYPELGNEAGGNDDMGGVSELIQQAWRSFINTLKGEKALLLFAQRKWLMDWFPEYDPTNADPFEEADRPWDFDHIHPSAHVERKRHIPELIKAWHGSIGNLRAWPLQANRGDGASSPARKLSSERAIAALRPFGISSMKDLLDASCVDDDELDYFERSTPEEGSSGPGYLGRADGYGEQRKYLVRAVVGRWLRLYRNWYESLNVIALGP